MVVDWNQALDDSFIWKYEIYVDGDLLKTVYDEDVCSAGLCYYSIKSLLPDHSYDLAVRAFDIKQATENDLTTNFSTLSLTVPAGGDVAQFDQTIPTTMKMLVSHLFTGDNPVQSGVNPDLLKDERIALLFGNVYETNGDEIIPSVTPAISIYNHPEYGLTSTQKSNGKYEMVINGGTYTLEFRKNGYLTSQRTVNVGWQKDNKIGELILVKKDAKTTEIKDFGIVPGKWQYHKSTSLGEGTAERAPLLLFASDSLPYFYDRNTSVENIDYENSIVVSATEYSAGTNENITSYSPGSAEGKNFSYIINVSEENTSEKELRIDGTPVAVYMENYKNIPVGHALSVEFYNEKENRWEQSEEGVAIEIRRNGSGIEVDVRSSDFTLSEEEKDNLHQIYYSEAPDESLNLIRIPIDKFGAFGVRNSGKFFSENRSRSFARNNPTPLVLPDIPSPPQPYITSEEELCDVVDIPGTPFSLSYSNRGAIGRNEEVLSVPILNEGAISDELVGVIVTTTYAERSSSRAFCNSGSEFCWIGNSCEETCKDRSDCDCIETISVVSGALSKDIEHTLSPGMKYNITLSPKDQYNRELQGAQPVNVRVEYIYYIKNPDNSNEKHEYRASRSWSSNAGKIRHKDAFGLGGFALNVQKVYDKRTGVITEGCGKSNLNRDMVLTIAHGHGNPPDIDFHQNGDLFFTALTVQAGYLKVMDAETKEVKTLWELENMSGLPSNRPNFTADTIGSIAITKDNNIYILRSMADRVGNETRNSSARIYRYDISSESGNAELVYSTPMYGFNPIDAITYNKLDNSVYFTEASVQKNRICRLAFNSEGKGICDQIFETSDRMLGITFNSKGELYYSSTTDYCVKKLVKHPFSDGLYISEIVAGKPGLMAKTVYQGDGVPAREALLIAPDKLVFDEDDNLYMSDSVSWLKKEQGVVNEVSNVVRKIPGGNKDSIIEIVLGTGTEKYRLGDDAFNHLYSEVKANDMRHPRDFDITMPSGIDFGADGSLYVAENAISDNSGNWWGTARILKVQSNLFKTKVPSAQGDHIYTFSKDGKHMKTVNALTGHPVYLFQYDDNGFLSQIKECSGNDQSCFGGRVTNINRSGNSVVFSTPGGHSVTILLDQEGYAKSISNGEERYAFQYHEESDLPKGLIASKSTPKHSYDFEYNSRGGLNEIKYPNGGTFNINSETVEDEDGVSVFKSAPSNFLQESVRVAMKIQETSPQGRVNTKYFSEGGISKKAVVIKPDGTNEFAESMNGMYSKVVKSDGTKLEQHSIPSSVFGPAKPSIDKTLYQTGSHTYQKIVKEEREGGVPILFKDSEAMMDFDSLTTTTYFVGGAAPVADLQSLDSVRKIINTYTRSDRKISVEKSAAHGNIKNYQVLNGVGRVIEAGFGAGTTFNPVKYEYNGAGNGAASGKIHKITQGSRLTEYSYNGRGYLQAVKVQVNSAKSVTTSFTDWDNIGRPLAATLPGDRDVLFDYDADGNMVSITTPKNERHEFNYDPYDTEQYYQPPSVGGVLAGNLKTTYGLNKDLRVTSVEIPSDSGVEKIEYCWDNSCDSGTATNGDGKLREVRIGSNGKVEYGYHSSSSALGKLESMKRTIERGDESDVATLNYTYDGSLLSSESLKVNSSTWGAVSMTYNDFMEPTKLSFKGVDIAIDDYGIVSGVEDIKFEYEPNTSLISVVKNVTGNTVKSKKVYTYNKYGEIKEVTSKYGAVDYFNVKYNGQIGEEFYHRDYLGRITTLEEKIKDAPAVTKSYEYDDAGRIIEVSKNNSVIETYTYDKQGNRTSFTSSDSAKSVPASEITYDSHDRLTKYGKYSYEYTLSGNLKSRTNSETDEVVNYHYDQFGNLLEVNIGDGVSETKKIEYIVDGRNRRIGKLVKRIGEPSYIWEYKFLYKDSLNPVAKLDASNNLVEYYVYASKKNVPDYIMKNTSSGWKKYLVISDHIGSVRMVVESSTGDVKKRIDYDTFGKIASETGTFDIEFGFAGGLHDKDTGLVRFGARDYDPETGRWTAKDPIRFKGGTLNLYEYCGNDPVNFVDTRGLVVEILYNSEAGVLSATDTDTGEHFEISVESGGKPYGDPIPKGEYEILYHPNPDFFRLDFIDNSPRDDIHGPTGRDHFRLHKPGRTTGCIAATKNDEWIGLRDMLNNTKTDTVSDNFQPWWRKMFFRKTDNTDIKKLGTLIVE